MAQNSWFSLSGCTHRHQVRLVAGGCSNLEAKLLLSAPQAELMHSPDPLGFIVCLIPLCGPSSPCTHSVCVLSPKLGAPSSGTIHSPDQENCLS